MLDARATQLTSDGLLRWSGLARQARHWGVELAANVLAWLSSFQNICFFQN